MIAADLELLFQAARVSPVLRDAATRVRTHVRRLEDAMCEYAGHQSWRCQYRSRYEVCVCGLDELMKSLGLPAVPVDDPEG